DLLDAFGPDYTVSDVGIPNAGGAVRLNHGGPANELLYSPAPGFSGDETLSYTVVDYTGGTREETVTVHVVSGKSDRDSAELRVEITGVNDIPALSGISDDTTTDKESIHPFAGVTVTDKDESGTQRQTVIVTFNADLGTVVSPGM